MLSVIIAIHCTFHQVDQFIHDRLNFSSNFTDLEKLSSLTNKSLGNATDETKMASKMASYDANDREAF